MPYTITTNEPFDAAVHVHRPAFTRRAVATLDEAREIASAAVPSTSGFHMAIRHLSESGGTVGPLPDGTVIEVEHVKWEFLLENAPPGVIERYPGDGGQPLLDAFNGAV